MNKKKLLKLILEEIKERIRQSEIQLGEIIRRANEAPGAMQSHSDTDKNLYGRQAAGQQEAIEVMKLEHSAGELLPDTISEIVDIGSLIVTEDEKGRNHYYLLPGGGGIKVDHENAQVIVITPKTPLGAALLGKKAGEIALVANRTLTILEIY